MASTPAVEVHNLHYGFTGAQTPALEGCDLVLEPGARCLLIGANGAGKSTLLRLLAGKRLCEANILVFGQDVFHAPPRGITYLGTEWAMNPVVRSDITVSDFLNSVGGFRFSERRDHLLDLLDVDLSWRMHMISDGERRRVQLCMGLMEPWKLLLLDEVTVDLDVQVRCDLLDFLREESEKRGATIVCAYTITHIIQMPLIFLMEFTTSLLVWYTCNWVALLHPCLCLGPYVSTVLHPHGPLRVFPSHSEMTLRQARYLWSSSPYSLLHLPGCVKIV